MTDDSPRKMRAVHHENCAYAHTDEAPCMYFKDGENFDDEGRWVSLGYLPYET